MRPRFLGPFPATAAPSGARGLSKTDFVRSLIDQGMPEAKQRPELTSAIERIQALGSGAAEAKRSGKVFADWWTLLSAR